MELLLNELSLHGQFKDLVSFRGAIRELMAIRKVAQRYGRELHCHRKIAQAAVTPEMSMPQAVQTLSLEERRSLMQWLTRYGPFWDEARNHGADEWFECNDNIVTDTAIAEVAWCCVNGMERSLVSAIPSNWDYTPIPVKWVVDEQAVKAIPVSNFWDADDVEALLQAAPVSLTSWEQLSALAVIRFTRLIFSVDAFSPLYGFPFVSGAAMRIIAVLEVLNRFKSCFGADGGRTPEGHEIYQDYFTGVKGKGGRGAVFSDSSDDEKERFKNEMTFKHPADIQKSLFCPWHGKIQTPQLRIHFSWPISANEPVYVVYVGPKITKR